MRKYELKPGAKLQIVTEFNKIRKLLPGKLDKKDFVRTEGGGAVNLVNILIDGKTLFFNCENMGHLDEGIIATGYDGGYGYIGLPVKLFKPEYQKQILEQLDGRYVKR
jgi:hypothetical protein